MQIQTGKRGVVDYDDFFERVPGRCGGRWTLIGRRLEPGMIHDMNENDGMTLDEIAKEYGVPLVEVIACIYFCQEQPDVLRMWREIGV